MAELFSTGYVNTLTRSSGDDLRTNLTGGKLIVYSGSVPSSADDDATSNTNLFTIKPAGGCGFDTTVVAGKLSKNSVTWSANADNTGVASFFRYFADSTDSNGASTTLIRAQGVVATGSGGEMQVGTTTITSGAPQAIQTFDLTMPKS